MVRATDSIDDPIERLVKFARHYTHGSYNQYDHLQYFSTIHSECVSLLVFGGKVYRVRGGWSWYLGDRKSLIAVSKLLESRDDIPPELEPFMERMTRQFQIIYGA